MNQPIGIPSGWEEIIAAFMHSEACMGPYKYYPMADYVFFHSRAVEQHGPYYLDPSLHDWRVED